MNTKNTPEIKSISIEDGIPFGRSVDVLNRCFGKSYGGWQRGSCRIGGNNDIVVWFPKLSVLKNGRHMAPEKGGHDWINVLSDDGKSVRMYTDDNHLENDNNWDLVHYAFAKGDDGKYKYIGTFVKRKTPNFPHDALFERIATSIDLSCWDAEIPPFIEDIGELKKLGAEKLFRLAAEQESDVPEVIMSEAPAKSFKRSLAVSEFAKMRAGGRCELCGNEAPFRGRDGEPYLETHHIIHLADGGPDTIDNTAALCPNCHRRMHALKDPGDIRKLREIPKCVIL